MNLAKVKKSLSECHLKSSGNFDIFKECSPEYLIDRTFEELKKIKLNQKQPILSKEHAKLVIQLMAMYRVKIEEQHGTSKN